MTERQETPLHERRADVLRIARGHFARLGYRKTDVQQVADDAGVGKGTVYRYFCSKEDLFFAAVDDGMTRLSGEIHAATASVSDPIDKIGGAARAYLAFFDRNPEVVELLMVERAEFRDRNKPTYFQHRDNNVAQWRELFLTLMKDGRVREMPVLRILDGFNDILYGIIFTNAFAGRRKTYRQQANDVLDLLFFGILTDEERQRRMGDGP